MTASHSPKTVPYSISDGEIARLVADIRRCRICVDTPKGRPLPHAPRPVLRVSKTARIAVCGQAPGTRVHASGTPFTDPSGDRLRGWMGVSADTFYDVARIAIVPMGFCFPGLDGNGGDLPPRGECAGAWHERVFRLMPQVDLLLLVGIHAQKWHLEKRAHGSLTETAADWRAISTPAPTRTQGRARAFPMPHPSWRNNGWLKRNPWFEADLLPELRAEVGVRLAG